MKPRVDVVDISRIKVGDRFRKDLGNISELVASIKEHGVIAPIAVKSEGCVEDLDEEFVLLAGERRFLAAHQAGVKEIPVRIYPQDTSDLEMRSIELEENIRRKDLEWIEQCNLQREVHYLQLAIHGAKVSTSKDAVGWTQKDTAELLGKSPASVSMDIKLAEAVEKFPELEWNKCKTKSDAVKVLGRVEEEFIRQELAKRLSKEHSEKGRDSIKKQLIDSFIIKDFFEGMDNLPDKSFDLIEIDPPFALGGRDLKDMKKKSGIYAYGDTYNEVPAEIYLDFLNDALYRCYEKMTDHSWLLLWFAPEPWFEDIYQVVTQRGFKTRRMPAIWTKTNLSGQTHNPHMYLGSAYEMFFYAQKGSPVIARQGRSNVFEYPPVPAHEKTHPTEKPIELYGDILSTFAFEGARILAGFLGSGNILLAANRLRMFALGFELSKQHKDSFILKVAK